MNGLHQHQLVIFSPNRNQISETFIASHIDLLPFDVVPRYGGHWRCQKSSGAQVWPVGRWLGSALRRLLPKLDKAIYGSFLARDLRKIGADAVLAEYGPTGADLVDGCKKAKVPLFVAFHGYDASSRGVLEQNREGYVRMFNSAAGIVAVSNAMMKCLGALGAPSHRLHLNPYGVDPGRFCGAKPECNAPIFVAVGRFIEKKAPYLTVLAFSKVLKVVPAARLIMVGDGPLIGPAKRITQALAISDAVDLQEPQNPARIAELLRGARAFVQHSLEAESGDSEGTPVAVIEAQMAGLPVVSTNHAGIPDVVINGETGFLVDEGDVDGMSEGMLRLAEDPVLAGRMGRSARKRAEVHYTLGRHLGQLTEMIEAGIRDHRRKIRSHGQK